MFVTVSGLEPDERKVSKTFKPHSAYRVWVSKTFNSFTHKMQVANFRVFSVIIGINPTCIYLLDGET